MNINLKVCGITSISSIKIAAENNIKSLGFASNNLKGPNFEIDTKYGVISETNYQTWNELLGNKVLYSCIVLVGYPLVFITSEANALNAGDFTSCCIILIEIDFTKSSPCSSS